MAATNMSIVLPVLVPMTTALASILAGDRPARHKWLGICGGAFHLAVAIWLVACVLRSGVLVSQLGGWPAPFGIVFVADRLAAGMVLLTALIGLLGSCFALRGLRGRRQLPRFIPLLHVMLAGCCGLFLTGDLFNFYVWFELLLVASFGLMALGNRRAQVEATTKYLAINILGSMLLLTGIGLLYALTGTLNMADLARLLEELPRRHLITAIALLLLVALAIKSAAFPLFFWLPASYHAPPIAVTAVFGGLLTKVGVYGLIRLFTLVFVQQPSYTHTLLLVLGGLTMITGVLGAIAQHDLRRLLSFHIISQIGYMLMGLGFFTIAGIGATLFFLLHIIVTKTALFFVSGVVQQATGSFELSRIGSLYARNPVVAAVFLVPALSLSGLPPFSGFVGKLALVQAGLDGRQYALVVTAVVVSLLTLYSMAKVWTLGFWSPAPADSGTASLPRQTARLLAGPAAVLGILTIAMGLAAEPLITYTTAAAENLLNREPYINAVLGEGRP